MGEVILMDEYQQFHDLKKEIASKLLSIQDGDSLKSYSDNMMENITNKEVFDQCFEMMLEVKNIVDRLEKIGE